MYDLIILKAAPNINRFVERSGYTLEQAVKKMWATKCELLMLENCELHAIHRMEVADEVQAEQIACLLDKVLDDEDSTDNWRKYCAVLTDRNTYVKRVTKVIPSITWPELV